MRLLITGATGALGRALVRRCLQEGHERIVVFSRSESAQAAFQAQLGAEHEDDVDALRWFIGDVRDRERLVEAFYHIDAVIHAAALKRVDMGAYQPAEIRKTNVEGSANVVAAAIAAKVGRVLMVSTDKAVHPTNVYGTSKAQMEHEAIASNSVAFPRGTRIGVIRYGNVIGSTGSVVAIWREQMRRGEPLTITQPDATRFWVTLEQAAGLCLDALDLLEGGEIIVPDLGAMSMASFADAFVLASGLDPDYPRVGVGMRPGGEKEHEQLLSADEVPRTRWRGNLYVVAPSLHPWTGKDPWRGRAVPSSFVYRSDMVNRIPVVTMQKILAELP